MHSTGFFCIILFSVYKPKVIEAERSSNMKYSHEVEQMCVVKKGPHHGPAPIPEEGKWVESTQIGDISGLSHGCLLYTSDAADE